MAKSNESNYYGTTFSTESMKVIGESIGIASLPDDAAKELADSTSTLVKLIIQDAAKFKNHSMRTRLMPADIEATLRLRNIPPHYGFQSADSLPFRFASGGGRELHFVEEKEIDLSEVQANAQEKPPLAVALRSHWLCIDGVQPTIAENPPPVCKELQKLDSVDHTQNKMHKPNKESAGKPSTGKQKLKNIETVQIKQLATHELSVEQQIYYKEITEACVGSDEIRRGEALHSLADDPGLHEMLPMMCTFIVEGVQVNVVQNNLALLIYLMRMVKALLDNPALFLDKYLHEIIPSVTTCIVSKQLCMRPELDNHWALRDFASRLMAQICKNFNSSTNRIQIRVTHIFSSALEQVETIPLSSLYGALEGLSELGPEAIKNYIMPHIRSIGARIEFHLEGSLLSNVDKTASAHIRTLLVKVVTPILKAQRNPPDFFEEYKAEFGYLGAAFQNAIIKARTQPIPTIMPSSTSFAQAGPSYSRTVTTMGMTQQATSTPGRSIIMNPPCRVTTPTGSQRIVYVSRSQPSTSQQTVEMMTSTNSPNAQPRAVGPEKKLMLPGMSNPTLANPRVINTQGQRTVSQNPSGQQGVSLLNPRRVHTNQPPFSAVPNINIIQQPRNPNMNVIQQPRNPHINIIQQPRYPNMNVIQQPRNPHINIIQQPRNPHINIIQQPRNPNMNVIQQPRNPHINIIQQPRNPNMNVIQQPRNPHINIVQQPRNPNMNVIQQPRNPNINIIQQPRNPNMNVIQQPRNPNINVIQQPRNIIQENVSRSRHMDPSSQ